MEYRVQFNAEVTFANGGALQVQEFRLDIPGPEITEAELGELFVRHLGLLMVGGVVISEKSVIQEPHKGSRAAETAPAGGRRLIELSHPIRDGLITYPGLPAPEISDHLSWADSQGKYAEGTEFQIGRISMVANTGTYLDTPAHRHRGGQDLSQVPLERTADLEGLVVRVRGQRAVDRSLLLPFEVRGRAVLIETGWDEHWDTERYGSSEHPFVTRDAAEWLAAEGAALVGIDSLNIDDIADSERPAHTVLLAAGIPIVEHMTGLAELPPHGFRFHAAPPRVEGMATFPVRAYAVVSTGE